jgi:hypothetical protein
MFISSFGVQLKVCGILNVFRVSEAFADKIFAESIRLKAF